MTTTSDFFQCLICNSFFSSLWKVEKHVKTHDGDEMQVGNGNGPQMGKRRGMLPIKKTTFFECYVPVVKNQIDPDFLAKYDNVEAKDENVQRKSTRNRELKILGVSDDVTEEDILKGPGKRPRRGNLRANANIRRAVAAILKVPDQDDDEDDSDKDFIEGLPCESDKDDDSSDFETHTDKKGGKQSRRGAKKKKKTQKWIWDGKEYPFKCDYCPHSFPKRMMRSFHIVYEHDDVSRKIKCPISLCKKYCVTFALMKDHIRYHCLAERREVFVEQEIERVRPDEKTLKSFGVFKCQFCLWSGDNSLEKLKKHKEKEHGKDVVLQCRSCEKTFQNSVTELIHHVKSCHPSILDPYDEQMKNKVDRKFKCEKCGLKYKYETLLQQHLAAHEKNDKKFDEAERIFKCPSCYKTFRYKDNLRRHFTLHLENNPWTCDFPDCNRKFNSSYNLRRHKLLHSESYLNRIYCPICNKTLKRKDSLDTHMRKVHKPEDVVNGVPLASKLKHRFRLPALRFRKYNTLSSNVGESCQTTANSGQPSSSTSAAELNGVHVANSLVKKEHGEEIHLIDKILLEEDGTAVHVKGERLSPQKITQQETKSKPVPLHPSCSSTSNNSVNSPFITPYNLTKLITADPAFKKLDPNSAEIQGILSRTYNYTYANAKIFTCKECQATFSRAWTLQLHLKAIHNKTLIDESTAIISQSSDDAATAANGNSSHSHKVTLMCGTCAYVAKDAQDLTKHMKSSHSAYRCERCGKSFGNAQTLQKHINKIHLAPRNHFCKHCEKGFTTEAKVRNHEKRVHEKPPKNEERKQCPICLKYFSPRSIDSHIKIHDRDAKDMDRLKCQLCGDVFSCSSALKRHIDCVHLGKPFNKVRNRRLALKKYPWLASRPPKPKQDDEWFRPLLQKMNGSATVRQETEASIRAPEPEEIEEGAMSILGI